MALLGDPLPELTSALLTCHPTVPPPDPITAADPRDLLLEQLVRPPTTNPRDRAAWTERRARLRADLRVFLGLDVLPDRLPLNAREQKTQPGDGWSLFRVEFQTWPGVSSTGWALRPAGEGRRPAILFVPPEPGELVAPEALAQCAPLVRAGIVVLALDGLEVDRPELGLSTAGLLTAAHLRALDYLAGNPEVDPARLGLLDLGYGSDLAGYVVALDERPATAAVAFQSETGSDSLPDRQAGTRIVPPGILRVAGRPELIAGMAPRPLLLLGSGGVSAAGRAVGGQGEILGIYGLYGLQERVEAAGPSTGEDLVPASALSWLTARLAGEAGDAEPAAPVGIDLTQSMRPSREPGAAEQTQAAIIEFYRQTVPAQPPKLESRPARKNYQVRLRVQLRDLLGETEREVPLDPLPQPDAPQDGESVLLQSAPGARVRLELCHPGAGAAPPLLFLEGPGSGNWSALREASLASGIAFARLHSRLALEADPEYSAALRLAGRSAAGMAARDAIAAVDYLVRRVDLDHRQVTLVGTGAGGVAAMLAAGWDERIAAVAADCGGTTYRDGGEGLPLLWGILRAADTPQLASLVAPRPLRLFNVPGERTGFSSRRYFDWTRRSYQSLGADEALRMDVDTAPAPRELVDWLRARFRRR